MHTKPEEVAVVPTKPDKSRCKTRKIRAGVLGALLDDLDGARGSTLWTKPLVNVDANSPYLRYAYSQGDACVRGMGTGDGTDRRRIRQR